MKKEKEEKKEINIPFNASNCVSAEIGGIALSAARDLLIKLIDLTIFFNLIL